MDYVEEFIHKFKFKYSKELEIVFTSGNCYYFAMILKERFNGEIYYLPIENHFICKIENKYYDIKGKIEVNETPYKWSSFIYHDEKLYKRIIRDCINFYGRNIEKWME